MNALSPAHHDSVWSFRDPDGIIEIPREGLVLRHLRGEGVPLARRLMASQTIQQLQLEGKWIGAEVDPDDSTILRHPRIWFPSYPHEWAPAMLQRAAKLTLEVNGSLLEENMELKDATPTNVLFEGTRPVFVDFLSPADREPFQMGWRAYGQFARTFLIPLLLQQKQRIPLQWMFLAHRDGISPETALPMFGMLNRFLPEAFGVITLPAWLAGRYSGTFQKEPITSIEVATAVTRRILHGLARRIENLIPPLPRKSTWFDYQDLGTSYTPEGLSEKEGFVTEALKLCRPSSVLDLGCNTGKYSVLASKAGARVVALDADPACVERLFLEAEIGELDIQPLVADLGRPSPRLGWNHQEQASLLDRLEGRFDMTFALALIHHMLVRERVPLHEIFAFIALTTRRFAIIEWVPPNDPQFKRLADSNSALYETLTLDQCLEVLAPWFKLRARMDISGCKRTLLLLDRLPSEIQG